MLLMPNFRNLWLSRFVSGKKINDWIRPNGRIKKTAFLETRPPYMTSMDAHREFGDIHWRVGRRICKKEGGIEGTAEIHGDEVRNVGLDFRWVWSVQNPIFHMGLTGWPKEGTADQLTIRNDYATDLAAASVFVPYGGRSGRVITPIVVSYVLLPSCSAQNLALFVKEISKLCRDHKCELICVNNGKKRELYKPFEEMEEAAKKIVVRSMEFEQLPEDRALMRGMRIASGSYAVRLCGEEWLSDKTLDDCQQAITSTAVNATSKISLPRLLGRGTTFRNCKVYDVQKLRSQLDGNKLNALGFVVAIFASFIRNFKFRAE